MSRKYLGHRIIKTKYQGHIALFDISFGKSLVSPSSAFLRQSNAETTAGGIVQSMDKPKTHFIKSIKSF